MDVEKNFVVDRAGDAMTLRFSLDNLPSGERAVLLDRELSREIDLRREPAYSFIIGEHSATDDAGQARFVLAVGSEAYVAGQRDLLPGLPSKTVLHQNTPNPFNPATVIRYDLARASDVTLRIYDLRGALVRNLEEVSRPAGRYEVGWNGENERGELVASGVYFYELRAGAFRQTKKMVLLK